MKQRETEKNNLDINEVYNRYVELYMHLDNLRWSFLAGILIVSAGLIGILQLFQNSPLFYAIIGLSLIILAYVINLYKKIIRQFVRGQDFITLLLGKIEEENKHIFNNKILSPKEEMKFISFYSRRKYFILNDSDKHIEHYADDGRQSQKYQNILKNVIIILYFIGGVIVVLSLGYLIWKYWKIFSQIIASISEYINIT